MSFQTLPTQLTGKTWIFVVQALVFGGLATFGLLLGPLFWSGIVKRADGKPGTEAGIALTIMAVPFLLIAALAIFNILARRRPIVRLRRDGIEINMIGSSSLDGIPLLPGLIRVAWLIVSLQGFKQQRLIAPWESLDHAEISGPPMARTLTIFGSFFRVEQAESGPSIAVAKQIAFREHAFNSPLDLVASTINTYRQNSELRNDLPGETVSQ